MKVEVCGKDSFSIFINRAYVKDIDFTIKDDVINFVRDFIVRLKTRLNLRGFYKIKVFPHDKVGFFLDVVKLDDMDMSNNLDLRIIIMSECDIFFETDNYELINTCNEKRYFDGLFYCIVDDSFDEILEKVEWGRFIYGREVVNLLTKGLIL